MFITFKRMAGATKIEHKVSMGPYKTFRVNHKYIYADGNVIAQLVEHTWFTNDDGWFHYFQIDEAKTSDLDEESKEYKEWAKSIVKGPNE